MSSSLRLSSMERSASSSGLLGEGDTDDICLDLAVFFSRAHCGAGYFVLDAHKVLQSLLVFFEHVLFETLDIDLHCNILFHSLVIKLTLIKHTKTHICTFY